MEVEIKFEPEGRSGVVATGSYLFDAAKRLGVTIPDCERRGETDLCAVEIQSGRNLLSEPTKAELETLDAERLIKGERLACQAKIVAAGEIIVMTKKKKPTAEEEKKTEDEKKAKDFRKEFEEMPLEKKVATLLELETVALSETLSFVINSPFKIFDKVVDVMAEFGLKIEKDDKNSKRPAEHQTEEAKAEKNGKKDSEKKTDTSADKADEESVVESIPVEEVGETIADETPKESKESSGGKETEENK